MSKYSVKIDILPGYGYSSEALYKYADTSKELNNVIASAKQNGAFYRISVNGTAKYESRGRGARKRWYKQ